MQEIHVFIVILLILTACKNDQTKLDKYPIALVNSNQIKLTDNFWQPKIKVLQDTTIAYALDKCKKEGRMDNFLIAGDAMKGETKEAMPFDDTDLYKIIEGASYSLIIAPDKKLES